MTVTTNQWPQPLRPSINALAATQFKSSSSSSSSDSKRDLMTIHTSPTAPPTVLTAVASWEPHAVTMSSATQPTDVRFSDALLNRLSLSPDLRTHIAPSPRIMPDLMDLQPPVHTPIQRTSNDSSIGSLAILAAELLFMILNLLDFPSLARLSQTSLLARTFVEQLPAYSLIMSHAPTTLTALGKLGLLSHHLPAALERALRSDRCRSCRTHLGGYLCLVSCERFCFECQFFQCATASYTMAKACFHLTDNQLKSIPIIRITPWSMWQRSLMKAKRTYKWRSVGLRQVKQLAIEIHGSAEAVRALSLESSSFNRRQRSQSMRWWREIPPNPTDGALFLQNGVRWPSEDYSQKPLVRFPTLTNNGLDYGNYCRGCRGHEVTSKSSFYQSPGNRLWSKSLFPQHVRECQGSKVLRSQWAAAEEGAEEAVASE